MNYALLDRYDLSKNDLITCMISSTVEEMVEFIIERLKDPSVKEEVREQIVNCFYENLHYGGINNYEESTGDEIVDSYISKAIEEIKSIEDDYPGCGIGDTHTDELITDHVESLLADFDDEWTLLLAKREKKKKKKKSANKN